MTEQQMGWRGIVVVYLLTILSMAPVGVIVALMGDLASAFGMTKQAVGLAIAMFSAPSAILALVCGGLIDRIGAKTAILISAAFAVAANLVIVVSASPEGLTIALLLAGVGFTGISVAAPAMIVTAESGPRRVKGMSLWSTYAPTGFALGLLLAAPFAGKGAWVPPLLIHAGLMALAGLAALSLPGIRPGALAGQMSVMERLRGFAAVLREIPVLRLAVATAIPSALSYGTSLVAPSYLAKVHGVTMGASATTVALAKALAMVLCGLATGQLLARNTNSLRLFALLVGAGIVAQFGIFHPLSGYWLATAGLVLWLIAFGGASATAMSLLPSVIRDPAHTGAASGAIGQLTSIFSFMAPAIYFGMDGWIGFVALAAAGLLISLAAIPAWKGRQPAVA